MPHDEPSAHVPAVQMPPQPSDAPHALPAQLGAHAQTFITPPAPHACPAGQTPRVQVCPHPSAAPHALPAQLGMHRGGGSPGSGGGLLEIDCDCVSTLSDVPTQPTAMQVEARQSTVMFVRVRMEGDGARHMPCGGRGVSRLAERV